jgi:hypothetical protein
MNILNLQLEQNSEAAAMNPSPPRRSQWQRYARYHQSRTNLLLHIVFVPVFLAGNVALLVALPGRHWLLAIGALAVTALSLAIQGRGHRGEPVPPEPFTGPLNAVARIFLEQWVTFPRFVLSGGWSRALWGHSNPTSGGA